MADVQAAPSAPVSNNVRFDTIWQQIQKHNSILFLRHALKTDMTLEQVLAALTYRDVHANVGQLRLSDVLNPSSARPAPSAASARTPLPQQVSRRKRRGPEEMHKLRELVLDRMRAAVGSITTSHLCEVLTNGGFEVDLLQMNRILNALAGEGYLLCLGGKPKQWRLKPQGRTAPEPMVVRRASPN